MKIESLCAADEPAWDAFVHAHPGASIYHLSGWRHLVADVFGHPSHHLLNPVLNHAGQSMAR